MMKKKATSILFWVLFFGLDALIAAGFCELWIRQFIPVKNVCWTYYETIGVHRCPDQRSYGYVEKDYANILETNSLGFHDMEWRKEKHPDSFRIQIYGDSLIVAQGVPTADSIPSQINRFLNGEKPPRRIEVMNMGSVDSTTSQILIHQNIGRQFQPDLVVCYFMNDFSDNLAFTHQKPHYPHYKLGNDGSLVFLPPEPLNLTAPWERFKKMSMFYRLMANKILESKAYYQWTQTWRQLRCFPSGMKGSGKRSTGGKYATTRQRLLITEGWPLTLKLIETFRDNVEKDGARFILADGTRFSSGGVGAVYSNEDLEEFSRRKGIPYIPSHQELAYMKRQTHEREQLFFKDQHPTVAGNRRLARFLADRLVPYIEQTETR